MILENNGNKVIYFDTGFKKLIIWQSLSLKTVNFIVNSTYLNVISLLTHEKLFKPFIMQLLFINLNNFISIFVNSEIIINYSLINYFINDGYY